MMQQNTPEWLEYRLTKIGASDAPAIMGVSPWSTPYQLWLEKVRLKDPKTMTCFMQRGLDLQDSALECFEKITGIAMFPEMRVHPKYDYMIASLDGISLDGQHMVEIKCPGEKAHAMALSGKIPDYYYPQLQHQLAVVGHEHMYYFSFDGEMGVVLDVYTNEQYIIDMLYKEGKFWECMKNGVAPEMTDKDLVHRGDLAWTVSAKDWLECKAALQEAKEREERSRSNLINICEDKNCFGANVKVAKSFRESSKGVTTSWRITQI